MPPDRGDCPPPSAPQPGARRAGRVPTIFAMGGGGFTMEPENPALDEYVRGLAPAREPRICLLPTAGGDSEDQIRRFHAAFADQLCEPTHVSLFRLGAQRVPLREHLLAQDVDLRRRRLDDQPARAVARPRRRRDPARGVAGGDRPRRPERRLDVLVRDGITKSTGAPRAGRAGSASCRARTPSTTTASRSAGPCSSTRSRAATIPPGLGRRRRRRPAVPRDARGGGRGLAPRRARLPRARGRRRGGRGGDRAARAHAPAAWTRRRRWPSPSSARCARRGRACWTRTSLRRARRARPDPRFAQAGAARQPRAARDARALAAPSASTRLARNAPVADSGTAATSSGVPAAIR